MRRSRRWSRQARGPQRLSAWWCAPRKSEELAVSSDLAGEVKDGVFQGKIVKPMDPYLFFPRASASLKDAPSVRIRVKITGKASAVIYFGTKAEPGFSGTKSAAASISSATASGTNTPSR